MDQKIKKKWVKALKSGKYRKATGNFKVKGNKCNKFCSLGVLMDLYCKETKKDWNSISFQDHVKSWAGLKDDSVQYESGRKSIVDLNDGNPSTKALSLKKIAELIEKDKSL